jgi:glycerol-3-phosphate acyltransferase PlsY
MLISVAIIFGSYLLGAVNLAYVAGRLMRGIDLRVHGSRNLGASNVWQSVSKPAVVPVGLGEIGQGWLGPTLARSAGRGERAQMAAGLAAIAGHNWSPFLAFQGGRGVSAAIGFMAAVSRPALVLFAILALAGVAFRKVPQFIGLGILAAPLAALVSRQSAMVVAGLAAMAGMIAAKRLLANEPPPTDEREHILLNRLLYDRDTKEREEWVADAG